MPEDVTNPEVGVKFTKYVKLVLPLDGYVFWVKADLLSASALFNAATFNSIALNQPLEVVTPAATVDVKGSLHYATDVGQGEDASFSTNRVIFTAERPVVDFNQIGPNVLFIGEWEGLKFAFSNRANWYQQAGIHHYSGDAVYPTLATQLIDKVEAFPKGGLIVSNSLPIWLSMSNLAAAPYEFFGNENLFMYPSFLAESNIVPPFAAVHIPPESTEAIAMSPTLGRRLEHSQLVRDSVKVTLWGLDNAAAMTFVDFVDQFTLNTGLMGVMNCPAVRDEKDLQIELGAIAKKKVIEYEVNYYQSAVRDVARQLILRAVPTYYID